MQARVRRSDPALVHVRWKTSDCSSYIPPVVDGKPITAHVPGFESENINVAGQSPNMGEISPRDFATGRYFTPEEDQRGAHVAVIGSNVARFAVSRRHGAWAAP